MFDRHEDWKKFTHDTHTEMCWKEPYTHTHIHALTAAAAAAICLENVFLSDSIPFFYYCYFFLSFFLLLFFPPHTYTHTHGNEATARPEGSLTNEPLEPRNGCCVCVCLSVLFSFWDQQQILGRFYFSFFSPSSFSLSSFPAPPLCATRGN